MLLKETLLPLIRLHLKVLQFCGRFPYSFDNSKNKLVFQNKNGLKGEYLKHAVLAVLSVIMAFQIFHYRNSFPSTVIYEGILYTCGLLTFILTVNVYFEKSDYVVELFNLLLRFEQNLFTGKLTKIWNSYLNGI